MGKMERSCENCDKSSIMPWNTWSSCADGCREIIDMYSQWTLRRDKRTCRNCDRSGYKSWNSSCALVITCSEKSHWKLSRELTVNYKKKQKKTIMGRKCETCQKHKEPLDLSCITCPCIDFKSGATKFTKWQQKQEKQMEYEPTEKCTTEIIFAEVRKSTCAKVKEEFVEYVNEALIEGCFAVIDSLPVKYDSSRWKRLTKTDTRSKWLLSKGFIKEVKPKLKPCPFCGSKEVESGRGVDITKWFVCCHICQTDGPVSHTEEQAANSWNIRIEG